MTASDDKGDVQPRGNEMKSGTSAPLPYQTSSAGVHTTGIRTADPLSRGQEFAGPGYRENDARKSGVDVGDVNYRQFDHTTIDREVVIVRCSRSCD